MYYLNNSYKFQFILNDNKFAISKMNLNFFLKHSNNNWKHKKGWAVLRITNYSN